MRRHRYTATLFGALVVATALSAPQAMAQTPGYPPGPCTTLTGSADVGTVTVGQRFIVQIAPTCQFDAGAPLSVDVNGVPIPGKVANANGFVTVAITAVSASQLSIDDPTLTPAFCGANTATASGPSAVAGVGGTVRQTARFTLRCPAAPVAVAQATSRLALTGTNVVKLMTTAALLAAFGWLIVLADRRRHKGRSLRF